MVVGALGGVVASVVCIFFTLRRLGRSSTRSLLAGSINRTERGSAASISATGHAEHTSPRGYRARFRAFPAALTLLGLSLVLAGYSRLIPQAAGFFGGGVVLLIA